MSTAEDPPLYTTPSPLNEAGLYTCPVCGWAGLEDPPYNRFGNPDYDICPCCGVEYGYQDADGNHARLRALWIEEGMIWHHPGSAPPPVGWDPIAQLNAAGF